MTTERFEDSAHGWFALRSDGSRMGTIERTGQGYAARSETSGALGLFDTKEAAWDAIAEDD